MTTGHRRRPAHAALACAGLVVAASLLPAQTPSSRPAASQSAALSALAGSSEYDTPQAVCELEDARVVEASGLVASRRHAGLFYTHNDSGNPAEVYLIDRQGRTRLTIVLTDAKNIDWEDIAVAPGRDGRFDVCVADIGDNNSKRPEVAIYRFPEPDLAAQADRKSTSQPADAPVTMAIKPSKYALRYADGPRNAEAFVVDPKNGDGYIIEKVPHGEVGVYRLPAEWQEMTTVRRVATLRFPTSLAIERLITGAAASPEGRRLAARSYTCGWEWRMPPAAGDKDFERIFTVEPTRLALAAEPQGEAIAYSPAGDALLTVSEKRPTVLYELKHSQQDAPR